LVFAAACLLLCLPLVAAADANRFEGTFILAQAVTSVGRADIDLPNSWSSLSLQSPGETDQLLGILTASQLKLHYEDITYYRVPAAGQDHYVYDPVEEGDGMHAGHVGISRTTEVRFNGDLEISNATLRLFGLGPDTALEARWFEHGSASLSTGAVCEIFAATIPDEPSDALSSALEQTAPIIQESAGDLVNDVVQHVTTQGRTKCHAGAVQIVGPVGISLANVRVEATFTNATGRPENRTFEATDFERPGSGAPGVVEVGETMISLNVTRDAAKINLGSANGQPTIAIQATTPALATSGGLQIPAAEGSLRWGSSTREGWIQSIRPEGTFQVSLLEPGQIDVRGATINEPTGMGTARAVPWSDADGTTGALLVAVAGAGILAYLGRGLLAGLYTRIAKPRAAEHPKRQAILDIVAAQPGASVNEVRQFSGMSRGSVLHHLQILEGHGLLMIRRVGRSTALFLPGKLPPDAQRRVVEARRGLARSVLSVLEQQPDLSQGEIRSVTGISQPYVSQLLNRLKQSQLVEEKVAEGRRVYRLTSHAASLVEGL
jgi:DNA-binding MarR family transcriptional regulator